MNDKARQHVLEWLRKTEQNLEAFYRMLGLDREQFLRTDEKQAK